MAGIGLIYLITVLGFTYLLREKDDEYHGF